MTHVKLLLALILFTSIRTFSQNVMQTDMQGTCLTVADNVAVLESSGYTIKSILITHNDFTEITLTNSDISSYAWLDTVFVLGVSIVGEREVSYTESNLSISEYLQSAKTQQNLGIKPLSNKGHLKSFQLSNKKYIDLWSNYFIIPKPVNSDYSITTNYRISLDLSPIISTSTIESENSPRKINTKTYALIVYSRIK